MIVDVRKLSNGAGATRPVYQHVHFCVRAFHLLILHPGYSLFLFFIVYLQTMDVLLYFKIRSRTPLDYNSLTATINQTTLQTIIEHVRLKSSEVHIFDPLPVKKIMLAPVVSLGTVDTSLSDRLALDSLRSVAACRVLRSKTTLHVLFAIRLTERDLVVPLLVVSDISEVVRK